MKIRVRRPAAEGRLIGETQSLIGSQRAVGQAAVNAEIQKFNALATGAIAGQNVLDQYQAEKDRAVLADAQAEYTRLMAEQQDALQNEPFETDSAGRIIETEGELQMRLQSRAMQAEKDILKGASARVRRAFDTWKKGVDAEQDIELRRLSRIRSNNVLTARSEGRIRAFEGQGDYVSAMAEVEYQRSKGLISPAKAQERLTSMHERRAVSYASAVMLDPNATEAQVLGVATDLIAGKYSDGSTMEVPFAERYRIKSALLADWDRREAALAAQAAQNKGENYATLYFEILGGMSPADAVLKTQTLYANDGLTAGDRDKLLGMIHAPAFGLDNDAPGAEAFMRRRFDELVQNMDYEDAVRQFKAELREAPGLSANTMVELQDDAAGRVRAVMNDPVTLNLRKSGYEAVTGHEEGMLINVNERLNGRYNDMILIGREFERDIMGKARDLGPDRLDDLEAYYEARVPVYRAKALTSELERIGFSGVWPEDGVIDDEWKQGFDASLREFLTNYSGDLDAYIDVVSILNNVERLAGVSLATPDLRTELQGTIGRLEAAQRGEE